MVVELVLELFEKLGVYLFDISKVVVVCYINIFNMILLLC